MIFSPTQAGDLAAVSGAADSALEVELKRGVGTFLSADAQSPRPHKPRPALTRLLDGLLERSVGALALFPLGD